MINKIYIIIFTKDQNTIIDVGCSQSSHWLGQFCSRGGPAALIIGEGLSGVQGRARCIPATRNNEDLKRNFQMILRFNKINNIKDIHSFV